MTKKNKATEVASSGKNVETKDKTQTISLLLKAIRIIQRHINKGIQDKENDLLLENNLLSQILALQDALKIERVFKIKKETFLTLEALQIVESIAQVVKNLLTIEDCSKKLSTPAELNNILSWVSTVDRLMEVYEKFKEGNVEKGETCVSIIVNMICCARNIGAIIDNTTMTLETTLYDTLTQILKRNNTIKEVVQNVLRIFSRLSLNASACEKMSNTSNMQLTLQELFDLYKENNAIIMRVSFIFANLTTFSDTLRPYIYFDLNGFNSSYSAFEHFISKTTNQDDFYESMLKSFSNFDFQKQDDKDVLNKLIRFFANQFTDEDIVLHFIKEKYNCYKFMLRKLRFFMTEQEVANNAEQLQCVLSCLSNLLYYDKPGILQNDFELASLKHDIQSAVGFIILQPKQDEILIEGLRVISNLSRSKNNIKQIMKIKFHEALNILQNHRSREVVYYSIGIIINQTHDSEFKLTRIATEIFQGLINIQEECTIDDVDILDCSLKAITNLMCDTVIKKINTPLLDIKEPNTKDELPTGSCHNHKGDLRNEKDNSNAIKRLEDVLCKYGMECDIILGVDEVSLEEKEEISSLRKIINTVINIIPEEKYECEIENCGRKFKSKEELSNHLVRRHNNTNLKKNTNLGNIE